VASDRISRRVGLWRHARTQFDALDGDVQDAVAGYANGVNAGRRRGVDRRAHEFALLRTAPTSMTKYDVLGVLGLLGLGLVAWDAKLARMAIVRLDGPEALHALEGGPRLSLPVSYSPGAMPGGSVDRLATDLELFARQAGLGGGSNNWVIGGMRTATGRPLLANDPHLAPVQPPQWYLAHLSTQDWKVAGASFVGLPAIPIGHNGRAAWGLTASLVDNTDLVVEQVGPDGQSVRRGDDWVACDVVTEVIEVRGGDPITEHVLVTPEGPIIGPALEGDQGAISLRATWLQSRRVRAIFGFHRVTSFDELRAECRYWPTAGQNLVYADTGGNIGWQLTGDAPTRARGHGLLPVAGADPATMWDGDVPYEQYPHVLNPLSGWIATANNQPVDDADAPYLGADWFDGFRVAAIGEALQACDDWDVGSTLSLQTDVSSLPWRQLRPTLLALETADPAAATAMRLLRRWDGRVEADSEPAAIFELFLETMRQRVIRAVAPQSAQWALGRSFHALAPRGFFGLRTSRLLHLLEERPAGWLTEGWDTAMESALALAAARVREFQRRGRRGWGQVRPLTLAHPLGQRPPLDRVFNLGPFPWGGDADTIAQANGTHDGPVVFTPTLRMVVDVGSWQDSRFSLSGGQSGNPCSAHYDDLHHGWRSGTGIPIPWTEHDVGTATVAALQLTAATRRPRRER
jgi:penicillin amidase